MNLHPVIQQLEADLERLQAHWCLPPEEARFLYLLTRISQAQHILEIGTSIGYSTLHLALAASQQGGHVWSIDASAERQEKARQSLQEAKLAPFVTLLHGDALTCLKQLCVTHPKHFDFIFVDARKSEYAAYFQHAETLLRSQGIILADNTRSHRTQMQDFIAALAASPLWQFSDLETPNGLILAQKSNAKSARTGGTETTSTSP